MLSGSAEGLGAVTEDGHRLMERNQVATWRPAFRFSPCGGGQVAEFSILGTQMFDF